MTHTDLIARLRLKGPQAHEQPNHHVRRMEIERIHAADALTAAQERIETLEGALSRIDVGHGWAAQIARAALDATEKGEE